MRRFVKHWYRVPRESIDSPSLGLLKTCECGTQGHGLVVDLVV